MKRLFFMISSAFLTSVILTACRGDSSIDTSKFTVEVVDGVRYIHNQSPQLGAAPGVTLEFIGKIGELEGKEDKDILYDPVDAARLPNGDILILEGNGCSIKRFNERHEFLSSFGRRGLGPGDFVSPYLMRLNSRRNRLYVADNRISWFLLDGKFINSFKPAKARLGGGSVDRLFSTSGMAMLSASRIILPGDPSIWEDPKERKLLSIYNEAGAVLGSFGVAKHYEDPRLTLNANVAHFATDGDDNCYIAFAFQNRIDKYSRDGKLVLSADRRLAFEVKNGLQELVFTSGSVKQVMSWPSVTSVTKGVFPDGDSRLWVLTFLIQPNKFGGFDGVDDMTRCYRFDVFDSDGILLFSVPVPNIRFNGFSIYDDRMYLIDSAHESCAYEFRIVERK